MESAGRKRPGEMCPREGLAWAEAWAFQASARCLEREETRKVKETAEPGSRQAHQFLSGKMTTTPAPAPVPLVSGAHALHLFFLNRSIQHCQISHGFQSLFKHSPFEFLKHTNENGGGKGSVVEGSRAGFGFCQHSIGMSLRRSLSSIRPPMQESRSRSNLFPCLPPRLLSSQHCLCLPNHILLVYL